MSSYERYLEDQIILKDKMIKTLESEVKAYKEYIESQLNCKIKETVVSSLDYGVGPRETMFKIIEIPRSRLVVNLGEKPGSSR